MRECKTDERPSRGRWAPGNYINQCFTCDAWFIGDKRANECADCAYYIQPPAEPKPHAGVGDEAIRTVALAICKSRTCEGYSCCQWPANMGRKNCTVPKGGYDDAAKAALDAAAPYIRSAELTHIHSLNAGLRLENSDLKGHAAVLEGKLVAKDRDTAAAIRDNDAKLAEIERLKAKLDRYNAWFDARQLFRSADEDRLDYEVKLEKVRQENDDALRHPDIEAAAERLEKLDVPFSVFHHNYGMASHVGRLTDVGRLAVARAALNAPENG